MHHRAPSHQGRELQGPGESPQWAAGDLSPRGDTGWGGWLARSRHPAAPRALRRDICIRNGSLAPELPRTQGQGEIRRSQQRWSWDPGTGHSPELGLVPAAHVQWLPPPHGDREPSLASQFCAATSFLPLLKLIIPEYKGLHSLQHPGSLRNAAPHTSANPDTLLSPSPAGAPGLLRCWDHGTITATSAAAWDTPQPSHRHPPTQAQHPLAVRTLAPSSTNCHAPEPAKPPRYCSGPPRAQVTAAHAALAGLWAAAARREQHPPRVQT